MDVRLAVTLKRNVHIIVAKVRNVTGVETKSSAVAVKRHVDLIVSLAGPDRQLSPKELEVAVLERGNGRRAFRRLEDDRVGELRGAA